MTHQTGRREASKQATRHALQQAATLLFAGQGYEHTTVRDIAAAAGVTERTFFRYFESKEDLVADQTLDWLPVVAAAIVHRPAAEPPLTAVREALLELSKVAATLDVRRPMPLWLFTDGPPAPRMRRSAPGLLLKFEAGLADAVRARLASGGSTDGTVPADYLAEIVARTAVAACRSAFIWDWRLRTSGVQDRASLPELLRQAFTVLGV
ncbi:MAG TPA: TetR family transcriptional regulator [Pseudonocardiaceae bacterium]|nr:TetR family transcriptional regulator [Pseudonocardiaceae bacterium]